MTKAPVAQPESLAVAARLLKDVEANTHLRAAYPAYKPSGLRWLGDLPDHWRVRKLKFIADVRNSNVDKKSVDGEEPVRLCNYVDVYYNDYITSDIEFMNATATREQIKRFAVQPDDVIITKDSEAWDDIAVPTLVTEEFDDVLCGYHLALIRPNPDEIDGGYLFRAFTSHAILDQFRVRANGVTRFGLPRDGITGAHFPVPPVEEQQAIAAFLRRETGKIDVLVEKKRRLVELLKEKRTALISHAVTKGLNPNAPMKPSGIDWLGDVPEHWRASPLKRIATLNSEDLGEQTDPEYLIEYIDIGNVDYVRGVVSSDVYVFDDAPSRARRRLRDGDTILSTVRTYLKAVAWIESAPDNLIASTGFAVLRPSEGQHPEYLYRLVQGSEFIGRVMAHSDGVTYPAIAPTVLGRLRLCIPPFEEQVAITSILRHETTEINNLIMKIDEAVVRLAEFRSTLITAAVTGKIDVRDEVPA